MSHETRTVFDLRAGPLEECEVRVRRVQGRERLSETYAFEVEFGSASGESLDWEGLCGAEGTLSLRRPGGPERWVHGVLWKTEMTGVAAGKPGYRVRIVPRLERLKHVKRSRVFQSMTLPEIMKEVLDEHGVKHRLSLSGSYSQREYCAQYKESDFEYLSRLLEDEGIFYWFEHGTEEHVMVLADAGGGCTELAGETAVPYRVPEQVGDAAEDEHLYRLEREHRLRPGKVELEDYDFERPLMEVTGRSQAKGAPELEVYEYPGGFVDPRLGAKRAQLRLEELRFGAETCRGESNCLRLVPGATFEVQGHPDASYDQKLLLVEVRHEGEQQEGAGEGEAIAHGYRNAFTALEASLPYRPLRRKARPVARPTTAMVVGPPGEEIHVDEYGRVKLQFHWDREGRRDDRSSCWVRVAQAWAGPAWGAQFAPRIGQEVYVEFLDGNPDRPVVMGAIYNGQNRPPIQLPHEKSKTTLKSSSSPGGDGSNELRFEDLKDAEEIYLHAQKDEQIEVENDKSQKVWANESLAVEKDRSIEVQGNQRLEVAKDDASQIGMSQTLTVTGNRETEVAGNHAETVGVAQTVTVGGNRDITVGAVSAESVGAAAALNVGGVYSVNVGGALNKAVGGAFTGQVGGWRLEAVGLTREERVGKDSEAKVGGDFATDVNGSVALATTGDQKEEVSGKTEVDVQGSVNLTAKEFDWEAVDKLSIVVGGKLMLSMEKSGAIKFFGTSITIDGQAIQLKGSQVKKVAAGAAASAAPKVRQLEEQKTGKATATVIAKDPSGNPLPNVRWRAEMPDGSVRKGRTDAEGKAVVPAPKSGEVKVTFTDDDR